MERETADSVTDSPVQARRGRKPYFWTDERRGDLAEMLKTMTFDQVGAKFGVSRNAIAGQVHQMRLAGDTRLPKMTRGKRPGTERRDTVNGVRRRFATPKASGTGIVLGERHPAVSEGRTLFPSSVVDPVKVKRILKSGQHQAKLGDRVVKGPWKGMPIYCLTLEERKTCPRACKQWRSCYGNNMHFAQRIQHDAVFLLRLEAELYALAAEHPAGFVVRLHILGDFFSVAYCWFWKARLYQLKALRIFGYTAHRRRGAIGKVIEGMNADYPDRCGIRFSGMEASEPNARGAIVVETRADLPAGAVLCPATTYREGKPLTDCCGTCGVICATSPKTIAFPRH